MYKPLPHGLFIEESSINGQGIHTNVKLTEDTNLGLSHVELTDKINLFRVENEITNTGNSKLLLKNCASTAHF